MYPNPLKVMECLREELGISEDNPVLKPRNLELNRHIRERRNRKASYIRDNMRQWEAENRKLAVEGKIITSVC